MLSIFKKKPEQSTLSKVGSLAGRAAILPLFIVGAKNALGYAEGLGGMTEAAAKKAGLGSLPVAGESLVKLNAYAQMGLGTTLALGIFPKLSAAGLVGSLVPTTLVGHNFWDKDDEQEKNDQKLQFVKNAAVIGGLLYMATRDNKR
ncbi:DoxX family protein [Corynebacterium sp.]|uniref:DoxX family protein n=1 Tax=Corynebacterium sp. TaxID=1720 RepID=UPI0026DCB7D8|nr:DoxX family protein [Corynebacterium sp.]MDO5031908.1 DoxX family protein [Corynebacterium sp.]